MSTRGSTIDKETLKSFASAAGSIGNAVSGLLKHKGWQVFLALYENKKREIKDRSDYKTLEQFKADRQALVIIEDIIGELEGYIDDAEAAEAMLTKFNNADESQTPGSLILSFEQGEEGREQG